MQHVHIDVPLGSSLLAVRSLVVWPPRQRAPPAVRTTDRTERGIWWGEKRERGEGRGGRGAETLREQLTVIISEVWGESVIQSRQGPFTKGHGAAAGEMGGISSRALLDAIYHVGAAPFVHQNNARF